MSNSTNRRIKNDLAHVYAVELLRDISDAISLEEYAQLYAMYRNAGIELLNRFDAAVEHQRHLLNPMNLPKDGAN
jgi:hypothetical protein